MSSTDPLQLLPIRESELAALVQLLDHVEEMTIAEANRRRAAVLGDNRRPHEALLYESLTRLQVCECDAADSIDTIRAALATVNRGGQ